MDGDERARILFRTVLREPRVRGIFAHGVWKKPRGVVFEKDRHAFEAARELDAGVRLASDLFVNAEEIAHAGAFEIRGEDAVGIKEPAHDLLEAREVFAQLRCELAVAREERGERAVFDAAHGLRVGRVFLGAAVQCEFGDVAVAEDLHAA